VEAALSPHLSNKKKFVTSLTLTRRSKYAATDFLTPIKATTPKRRRSKKVTSPTKAVKSKRTTTKSKQPVKRKKRAEVELESRDEEKQPVKQEQLIEVELPNHDNENISMNDSDVELDEKQLYNNDLRSLVLFLGMERQLKDKNTPNWSQLAIASTYQSAE
jgi:hypothetical protein